MRIESGPTGERKVRSTLLMLMLLTFAVWFAYDGWVGYPKRNLAEYEKVLPPEARAHIHSARAYPPVTESVRPQAEQALAHGTAAEQRAALERLFGGPPSVESPDEWIYLGHDGMLRIPLHDRRPTGRVDFMHAQKGATDIRTQKVLSIAIVVAAVIALWHVIRVRRTHLLLDDTGLIYRTKKPIAWMQMKRLDASRFKAKGWVDLYYDDHGTERRVRIDEYHIAAFDDVIDAVCEKRQFENPLPPPEQRAATGEEAS